MCRQTLESKELYVGLLQKKVAALEERVQEISHRETQLETTAGKVWLSTIYVQLYDIVFEILHMDITMCTCLE